MTKQKDRGQEAPPGNASGGTDEQAGGGVTPAAGGVPQGEAPATPPPNDNNNPMMPAAAVATAPVSDPDPTDKRNPPIVADLDADEERRDATDKRERPRKREPEPLNDAVGSGIVAYGWGRATWTLKRGEEFAVTRFYPTKGVAIDFPVDEVEAATCDEKRAKLHEHGVAYVAIMPGKNMTIVEIEEAIDREWAVLAEGR